MLVTILALIGSVEEFFWLVIATPSLIALGLYFSVKSRFFQIRKFPAVIRLLYSFTQQKQKKNERGISPIHAFFAAVGGAIGIGNLVGVCMAVKIGGPGAVFWMWIAALMGMLVKYGEIYLGVLFREKNEEHSYTGGPMIYLKHAPAGWFFAKISTFLMCLYGIEIYIFRIVAHTVSTGWNITYPLVVITLLALVIFVGRGGVRLVGKICSFVIPIFLIGYVAVSSWVLIYHFDRLPHVFMLIFEHAFQPHAALGAFMGNTVFLAISQGTQRACYAGDIGIGYASTMHAETSEAVPARQASLGIIDTFFESFLVCTLSLLLVLVTDVWHQDIDTAFMVPKALSTCFAGIELVWPFFIFLLGYTTLIAFFAAGRRAATVLFPKAGAQLYVVASLISFILFSVIGTYEQCLSIMSIIGSMLLMCNLYGLFALRKYITFGFDV